MLSARARIGLRSDARVGIDTASTPVHRLFNGDARGESQAKLQFGGQWPRLPPGEKLRARLLLVRLLLFGCDLVLDSGEEDESVPATVQVASEKKQTREQEACPGPFGIAREGEAISKFLQDPLGVRPLAKIQRSNKKSAVTLGPVHSRRDTCFSRKVLFSPHLSSPLARAPLPHRMKQAKAPHRAHRSPDRRDTADRGLQQFGHQTTHTRTPMVRSTHSTPTSPPAQSTEASGVCISQKRHSSDGPQRPDLATRTR